MLSKTFLTKSKIQKINEVDLGGCVSLNVVFIKYFSGVV